MDNKNRIEGLKKIKERAISDWKIDEYPISGAGKKRIAKALDTVIEELDKK